MKIKGFTNKLYRLNSNSIKCSVSNFEKLKDGKVVDIQKEEAEQLINMGFAEKLTEVKKGDK
tara:strand:- start:4839 stop:5024 length:186 start_codon:yes stop_codon:yes gene_type:complete